MLPETRLRLAIDVAQPPGDETMRALLVTWLFARARGGEVLLRLDNDAAAPPGAINALFDDFEWLGLDWDEYGRQSSRIGRHHRALDRLKRAGHLYSCFETDEELSALGDKPYDRRALLQTPEEQAGLVAIGQRPHLRFRLPDRDIEWNDLVSSKQIIPARTLSDPIVMTADETPSRLLAAAVDDGEMLTSHILAPVSEMHQNATKRAIMEVLGYRLPELGHLPPLGLSGISTIAAARSFADRPSAYLRSLLSVSPELAEAQRIEDWLRHFSLVRHAAVA